MSARLIEFPTMTDPRGYLTFGEVGKHVPFDIKRFFVIGDVPGVDVVRGAHAHRSCEQLLVCVKGQCRVDIEDKQGTKTYILEKNNLGLYLPPLTWGVEHAFSADAMLLVFASELYNKDEYITDKDEFYTLIQS